MDPKANQNEGSNPNDPSSVKPRQPRRRSVLVDKLAKISRNVIKKRKKERLQRESFNENEFGQLPPPDYYYQIDEYEMDEVQDEEHETFGYTPVGRNAVEMGSRFYVERNLFSYLAHTTMPNEKNYYDDDEVDLSCFTQKPVSYIILGKPGIGKTSLANRLAETLKAVHISPEEVIEYYRFQNVIHHLRVNEVLDSGGTIDDRNVVTLIEARVTELDVLHRGYVLDGFPMVTSEELSVEEQIEFLKNLSLQPQFVILLNMQDVDLYKRRIEQKYDPDTSKIYIRDHYSKFNPDTNVFPLSHHDHSNKKGVRKSAKSAGQEAPDVADILDFISDSGASVSSGRLVDNGREFDEEDELHEKSEDPLDGSWDFKPLPPDVLFRLITRTEDNPVLVNDDLEQFRYNLQAMQEYVEGFDKRNVLELDAYWAPSVLYRRTMEFLESSGVRAVSIPKQIMRPLDLPVFRRSDSGEFLGEDDDSEAPCPDDEPPPEIDWESAMRACSVRGLVDPRFRWRISRWQNMCPVALKYGRTVVGKPELATSYLDKIFFMSSPEAVEQFIFNPRPYLLPKMPTSPIKFFVLGHPLAGKSTFAKEMAFLTKSTVVDMNHEMEKRYAQVKHDYLYKKRLQYTLEAKLLVDKENRKAWRKEERARRAAMHKWIDDYIRSLAEAELRAALEADRARRKAEREAWRKESEYHKLKFPVYMDAGACQMDESHRTFSWKDFIADVHDGKTSWTHQELLELAWDLFHQRKLYYKLFKRDSVKVTLFGELDEDKEEFGLVSDLFGGESDSGSETEIEDLGEFDADNEGGDTAPKKKKRRRRRHCRKLHIKPDVKEEPEEIEEELSSDIDPDDPELEESIRMRYPKMPKELVDIVPVPTAVPDHHPKVEDIVSRRLEEDEKYVHSLPVELYIEVLRRACSDAEGKYHHLNTHGPLSGGWVVENLMTDIEKFRAILRTPEVCPDQVFLLTDPSENNANIYRRLKKIFQLKNVPTDKKLTLEEIAGEGGYLEEPGEGIEFPSELNLQTASAFIESLLPADNLIELVHDTPSEIVQLLMDAHRDRTPASDENEAENYDALLSQHEKFILDQVRSKISSEASARTCSSSSSEAVRRMIAAEFKSLQAEMSAFVPIVGGGNSTSRTSTADQFKDDVKVITEYLRHSREIGSLSYSQDAQGMDDTDFEQLLTDSMQQQGSGASSARSVLGEDDNVRRKEEDVATPDGLRSITALSTELTTNPCPEGLTVDEKAKCLREQQEQKIESPKRRFFIQIRLFNEFWNMAIPVCNEQGVKYWEVGLVEENNARKKGLQLWDDLERRFQLRAKRISENELKEEDEEIHESLMKWGEPYEHNNFKGVPVSRESTATIQNKKGKSTEGSDEDRSDEYESEEDDLREDQDLLAPLEGKPDVYWKTVRKIESQRCFGDMKYYCPVTFTELNILRKGSSQYACKFRDRLYYCGDDECQGKFVQTPAQYLPLAQPKVPPPPRICITGSPGCGQEEVALKICKEYNICYVNFRQRLHELMKARFGKNIGPDKTGEIIERYQSEKIITEASSKDDLLNGPGSERLGEDGSYYEYDGENDTSFSKARGVQDPAEQAEKDSVDEAALKSLGLLDLAKINTVPIGSIERAERLTERKWKRLTKVESYVQAFLENGLQLPDAVLDEFIGPLWNEPPFNQVGFILVGFPNTEMDIKYLLKNKFYPEMVYLLDCNPLVIRNRLLMNAVDQWHKEKNPSGKRKKRISEQDRFMAKALVSADKLKSKKNDQGFEYQTEGRPEIDEFEKETWTYNDRISRKITKSLKHYHNIYSKGIRVMKQSLNRNSVDWMPINTDVSLLEAKRLLIDHITPKIKHRSSIFEDTVRLNLKEAKVLLHQGFFEISRFQRWCPTELSLGNTSINLWNAPGVKKIPILYRRYIYFLAGEKNAKCFEGNCWQLINQESPMNTVPAVVVVMGPPKSGKTNLAARIANRLGLVYISGTEMIDSVVKHSFASQWADVLTDLEPVVLKDGPQPMLLSEEVLNFIRNGATVPKFLVYRALDLALLQPKAQYHGVVFDDYPVTEDELQEMLYKGLVPSTVIKLDIEKEEAYLRCQRNRKPDYNFEDVPQEGNVMLDYSTSNYEDASETTLFWFQNEIQNVLQLDGTQNMEFIFRKAAEQCKYNMKKMQQYLVNVLQEKPSTLEGTCPLTSQIPLRLSPDFGFYCPVALNENDDLIRVANITELSEVVEYKGFVYVFSSHHNVRKFMANPNKYIPPNCKRTPPKEVPITCLLTASQFEQLKEHWGFMDFDTVRYYDANHHYKGLQRGDAKHCVAYRNKLYCFLNEANMAQFMKKPERYWNQLLPLKVPRKTEPMDMEKITSYSYLIAKGVLSEVKKVIQLTGEKRPRVPFMSLDRCAALFMGYYFKAQNMNAPYEIRQKYRNAMFDMMTKKTKTKKFLDELKGYYGCRLKTLPERLKTRLDGFLSMETMKDEERVLVPSIPGVALSRNIVKVSEDEFEITHRYQKVKQLLFQVDVMEKIEAFDLYSSRKKAADENKMKVEADNQITNQPERSKVKIS